MSAVPVLVPGAAAAAGSATPAAAPAATGKRKDRGAAPGPQTKTKNKPKKPKKSKKPKMTTPERRERKRIRDRERRRLRRQKQRAAARAAAAAAPGAAPVPAAPVPAAPAPAAPAPAAPAPLAANVAPCEASEVYATTRRRPTTRVTAADTPDILSMEGNVVPQDATVAAETASFNRAQASSGFDAWLEAEMKHVMSTKVEDNFSLETSARVDQLREDLPRLRRAEEDALLEETKEPRRVCRMGEFCESVRLSKAKGVSPPIRLPMVQQDNFDFQQCLMLSLIHI